jgi:hypothetical protein
MTPHEFNSKYPNLTADQNGYITKGTFVRISSFYELHNLLERKPGTLRSKLLNSAKIKDVERFVMDFVATVPYWNVYKKNASRNFGTSKASQAGPALVVRKQFIKPADLEAAVKLNPESNKKKIEEYDFKREAAMLNLIIEVCNDFKVSDYNTKDNGLYVKYFKASSDHTGDFRIAFDEGFSSVFRKRAFAAVATAKQIHDILY